MKRILVIVVILGVAGGAGFGIYKYLLSKPKPPSLEGIAHNLAPLPDGFFTKWAIDKAKSAKEAFERPKLKDPTVKRGMISLTADPSGNLNIKGPPEPCKPILVALYSPDDKHLAALCKEEGLVLWETTKGARRGVLFPGMLPMQPLGFSPDGRFVAAIREKGRLVLWDVLTGKESLSIFETGSSIVSFAFSHDGKIVASGDKAGMIKLWDVSNGALAGWMKPFEKPVVSVGFHPVNSDLLFAAESPDRVESWVWERDGMSFAPGSAPTGATSPQAHARLSSGDSATAGDKMRISVVVDNSKGKGDLFQLAAITGSPQEPMLEKRLMIFGKVAAGEISTRTAVFETDYRWPDRHVPLDFRFVEGNEVAPDTASVTIPIRGLSQPDFGMAVKPYEGQEGRGVGNADGALQSTESPEIEIAVTNTGGGQAGKTTIEVAFEPASAAGVQIFGNLKHETSSYLESGVTAKHNFSLRLKPIFKLEALELTVKAREAKFGVEKTQMFSIPVRLSEKR